MPISEDSRAALVLLKEVQQSVRDTEDLNNNAQVGAKKAIQGGLYIRYLSVFGPPIA